MTPVRFQHHLVIDECEFCGCQTDLAGYTIYSAFDSILDGKLSCWNCEDQGDPHSNFVLFWDQKAIWDGRSKRAKEKEPIQLEIPVEVDEYTRALFSPKEELSVLLLSKNSKVREKAMERLGKIR